MENHSVYVAVLLAALAGTAASAESPDQGAFDLMAGLKESLCSSQAGKEFLAKLDGFGISGGVTVRAGLSYNAERVFFRSVPSGDNSKMRIMDFHYPALNISSQRQAPVSVGLNLIFGCGRNHENYMGYFVSGGVGGARFSMGLTDKIFEDVAKFLVGDVNINGPIFDEQLRKFSEAASRLKEAIAELKKNPAAGVAAAGIDGGLPGMGGVDDLITRGEAMVANYDGYVTKMRDLREQMKRWSGLAAGPEKDQLKLTIVSNGASLVQDLSSSRSDLASRVVPLFAGNTTDSVPRAGTLTAFRGGPPMDPGVASVVRAVNSADWGMDRTFCLEEPFTGRGFTPRLLQVDNCGTPRVTGVELQRPGLPSRRRPNTIRVVTDEPGTGTLDDLRWRLAPGAQPLTIRVGNENSLGLTLPGLPAALNPRAALPATGDQRRWIDHAEYVRARRQYYDALIACHELAVSTRGLMIRTHDDVAGARLGQPFNANAGQQKDEGYFNGCNAITVPLSELKKDGAKAIWKYLKLAGVVASSMVGGTPAGALRQVPLAAAEAAKEATGALPEVGGGFSHYYPVTRTVHDFETPAPLKATLNAIEACQAPVPDGGTPRVGAAERRDTDALAHARRRPAGETHM